MFSIICPTMWRSKGLETMVRQQMLLNNPDVGELLIVDNDPAKAPKQFEHPKMRYIYRGPNIFVNPAWNYGVKQARCDNLALMSDDIVFDPSVFSQLKMQPNAGIIGLGEGCDKGLAGTITPRKIQLHPCTLPYTQYEHQFGMLMLFHRAAFLPIPDEAKIFLGDVWLYDFNNHRGVRNYYINNLDVVMERGATSQSPDLQGRGFHELNNAKDFFDRHRHLFTLTAESLRLLGR